MNTEKLSERCQRHRTEYPAWSGCPECAEEKWVIDRSAYLRTLSEEGDTDAHLFLFHDFNALAQEQEEGLERLAEGVRRVLLACWIVGGLMAVWAIGYCLRLWGFWI